ncbi:MAG: hypothetical protein N2484_17105 [Clostridia bacterium]|nr:hypothetical protein [Clostridia bacterium]
MKKLNAIILAVVLTMVMASCAKSEYGIEGDSLIDWVDFIKLNGKMYSSIGSAILSDSTKVKQPIAEVKFQVDGAVSNPDYKIKDGDAAFWPKGTKIFALEGYTDHSLVAVKDDRSINGYRLYCLSGEKASYRWHYKDMPKDKVNRIDVYPFDNRNHEKPILQIDDMKTVKEVIATLDQGTKYEMVNQNLNPAHYLVFQTGEIFAYKYGIYSDGKRFYWAPWDMMILPEKFREYVGLE